MYEMSNVFLKHLSTQLLRSRIAFVFGCLQKQKHTRVF